MDIDPEEPHEDEGDEDRSGNGGGDDDRISESHADKDDENDEEDALKQIKAKAPNRFFNGIGLIKHLLESDILGQTAFEGVDGGCHVFADEHDVPVFLEVAREQDRLVFAFLDFIAGFSEIEMDVRNIGKLQDGTVFSGNAHDDIFDFFNGLEGASRLHIDFHASGVQGPGGNLDILAFQKPGDLIQGQIQLIEGLEIDFRNDVFFLLAVDFKSRNAFYLRKLVPEGFGVRGELLVGVVFAGHADDDAGGFNEIRIHFHRFAFIRKRVLDILHFLAQVQPGLFGVCSVDQTDNVDGNGIPGVGVRIVIPRDLFEFVLDFGRHEGSDILGGCARVDDGDHGDGGVDLGVFLPRGNIVAVGAQKKHDRQDEQGDLPVFDGGVDGSVHTITPIPQ